jgi:hypothetical protein
MSDEQAAAVEGERARMVFLNEHVFSLVHPIAAHFASCIRSIVAGPKIHDFLKNLNSHPLLQYNGGSD